MARFPLVYCLNTRCWLHDLREQGGPALTLADVPDREFVQWERLGFSHIWLLGVWRTGPRARAVALTRDYRDALPDCRQNDVQASPYAIADYRVDDRLGGESALAAFHARLHRYGLKLMLDFVPNHVGLDHPWVEERPELFVRLPPGSPGAFRAANSELFWLAHGRDPNFPPWADTVQLDYRRLDTRRAMTDLLVSICGRCDAVRCDMAMLLLRDVIARVWPGPNEAGPEECWPGAIQSAKTLHPDCLFVAEAYWGLEGALQNQGFHYAYDKVLYDRVIAGDWRKLQSHVYSQSSDFLARSVHFLENHDEARAASLLSPKAHRVAAFLMLCLPGMRLLHEGQLAGARVKTPIQLVRRLREPVDPDLAVVYEKLLTTLRRTAVGQGTPELLRPEPAEAGSAPESCLLVAWHSNPGPVFLCAVNLASHPAQCAASLPQRIGASSDHGLFFERLLPECISEPATVTSRNGRLLLDLPPYGACLLEIP